jgi:hypothetical protein
MNANRFRPVYTVKPEIVEGLFLKPGERVKLYSTEAPDELKPELFQNP